MVTPSGALLLLLLDSFDHAEIEWLFRVSCVRFSPNVLNPVIVSVGWDKVVKVSFSPFRYAVDSLFAFE